MGCSGCGKRRKKFRDLIKQVKGEPEDTKKVEDIKRPSRKERIEARSKRIEARKRRIQRRNAKIIKQREQENNQQ